MFYIDEQGNIRAKKEDANLLSFTLSNINDQSQSSIIDSPRDILLPVAAIFYSVTIFFLLFSKVKISKLTTMNRKIMSAVVFSMIFAASGFAYSIYTSQRYEQDKERLKAHTRVLTLTGCKYAEIALERAVAGILQPDGEYLLRVAEKNFNRECPQGR